MTPREPDRFEEKARELQLRIAAADYFDELIRVLAAALRQAADEALERAAHDLSEKLLALRDSKKETRERMAYEIAAGHVRAIASPAAAPAAEVSALLGRGYVEHPREGEPGDAETYSEPVAPAPYTAPVTSREPAPIEINLNVTVWVRVTPVGERVYEAHWRELHLDPPLLLRDSEGWTRFQLWELAHIFGRAMFNGGSVPVETTIKVAALADGGEGKT